ncbi:MAG: hypothetical protein IPM79_25215 [Polyangiaceae bacterium]|jgi:hypothetical protein|nr:hypothetical protein [Polyangiaceae bacterium]
MRHLSRHFALGAALCAALCGAAGCFTFVSFDLDDAGGGGSGAAAGGAGGEVSGGGGTAGGGGEGGQGHPLVGCGPQPSEPEVLAELRFSQEGVGSSSFSLHHLDTDMFAVVGTVKGTLAQASFGCIESIAQGDTLIAPFHLATGCVPSPPISETTARLQAAARPGGGLVLMRRTPGGVTTVERLQADLTAEGPVISVSADAGVSQVAFEHVHEHAGKVYLAGNLFRTGTSPTLDVSVGGSDGAFPLSGSFLGTAASAEAVYLQLDPNTGAEFGALLADAEPTDAFNDSFVLLTTELTHAVATVDCEAAGSAYQVFGLPFVPIDNCSDTTFSGNDIAARELGDGRVLLRTRPGATVLDLSVAPTVRETLPSFDAVDAAEAPGAPIVAGVNTAGGGVELRCIDPANAWTYSLAGSKRVYDVLDVGGEIFILDVIDGKSGEVVRLLHAPRPGG